MVFIIARHYPVNQKNKKYMWLVLHSKELKCSLNKISNKNGITNLETLECRPPKSFRYSAAHYNSRFEYTMNALIST